MHFWFIACAICNVAFFFEARPIEFDFNSNIVNVINHSPASNTGNYTQYCLISTTVFFLILVFKLLVCADFWQRTHIAHILGVCSARTRTP